jgi:hypothetical protein
MVPKGHEYPLVVKQYFHYQNDSTVNSTFHPYNILIKFCIYIIKNIEFYLIMLDDNLFWWILTCVDVVKCGIKEAGLCVGKHKI